MENWRRKTHENERTNPENPTLSQKNTKRELRRIVRELHCLPNGKSSPCPTCKSGERTGPRHIPVKYRLTEIERLFKVSGEKSKSRTWDLDSEWPWHFQQKALKPEDSSAKASCFQWGRRKQSLISQNYKCEHRISFPKKKFICQIDFLQKSVGDKQIN